VALGALFASSAEAVRQQDRIADLNAFVMNFAANGTNDAGSLMAKDRWWVAQTGE
jgi:hypothetical protein